VFERKEARLVVEKLVVEKFAKLFTKYQRIQDDESDS
jgi:hypothetical protein